MKTFILIPILLLSISFNISANDVYPNRGFFGIGILGPFPSTFQLNFGQKIEVEIGIYNGLKNLFKNFDTMFASLDFIISTFNFSEESHMIDMSIGIGLYGLWWISEWENTHRIYNSMNIGGRLSFILNFAIVKRSFDIFLKAGPGINIWGGGGNLAQRWEIFAGLGLRVWFI
ncbi:hypothetical protein CR532_02945 [Candidatus Borreliella tachyglossi]|uniref:DUF3996 domain-containing protein n=1 Tax=Candidatus Borreliella tachyglossi TaxID=1964448 RepID=A0A2S1LX98_9SPIR|nr:DUF3996 domain-containing protein [Candidatus Borreliella tachyglossi]AWG42929.1 hypothetical protein CR532_02945 [Candidatus Borreliella tachyglossi]